MPTIVPIPGATTASRVRENMTVVELDSAYLRDIDMVLASFETAGHRYPDMLADQLMV